MKRLLLILSMSCRYSAYALLAVAALAMLYVLFWRAGRDGAPVALYIVLPAITTILVLWVASLILKAFADRT